MYISYDSRKTTAGARKTVAASVFSTQEKRNKRVFIAHARSTLTTLRGLAPIFFLGIVGNTCVSTYFLHVYAPKKRVSSHTNLTESAPILFIFLSSGLLVCTFTGRCPWHHTSIAVVGWGESRIFSGYTQSQAVLFVYQIRPPQL